jgi:hypothetical protein
LSSESRSALTASMDSAVRSVLAGWSSARSRLPSRRHSQPADIDASNAPDAPRELDVVEFIEEWEGWPAGTSGTIVQSFAENGLIEIVDGDGETAGSAVVPYRFVSVAWRASDHAAFSATA